MAVPGDWLDVSLVELIYGMLVTFKSFEMRRTYARLVGDR
jgi:hypothetical protein